MQQDEDQMTPQQQAHHIAQLIQQAAQECQADLERTSEPKARVVFEGVIEILSRAIKVLNEYSTGKEPTFHIPAYEKRPLSEAIDQKTPPPAVTEFAVDVDSSEPPPRIYTEIPKE